MLPWRVGLGFGSAHGIRTMPADAISNRHATEGLERLWNVQILRAVAATAVLYFHGINGLSSSKLGPGVLLATGSWGVDLFFVISGFIMVYITQKSPRGFFARRFLRVAPL